MESRCELWKVLAVLVLAGYAGQISSQPDSEAVFASVFAARYELVDVRSALPKVILAEIEPIADPDKEFNATDVIWDSLPGRQLIEAAVSDSTVIVLFWQGGRALYQMVALFRSASNGKYEVCYFSVSVHVDDIASLRRSVEGDSFLVSQDVCHLTTPSSG